MQSSNRNVSGSSGIVNSGFYSGIGLGNYNYDSTGQLVNRMASNRSTTFNSPPPASNVFAMMESSQPLAFNSSNSQFSHFTGMGNVAGKSRHPASMSLRASSFASNPMFFGNDGRGY
jgi:hypothetical protein